MSFAHGGNDGQKGMGIIMLILIGVAPTAYALNRTMPNNATPAFLKTSAAAAKAFQSHANAAPPPQVADARRTVDSALSDSGLDKPQTFAALSVLSQDIGNQVKVGGSGQQGARSPDPERPQQRCISPPQAITQIGKKKIGGFSAADAKTLKSFSGLLNNGTRFIPIWVKITVALALGLGTMIGWKRIVVTVGEKIGKQHLSYAQGASAEIIAAITIGGAEYLGLPVSTTHILSSGVAGTMVANGSGLQWSTVRNIALAWVLTLPAAITIAGLLYAALSSVIGGLH